MRQEQRFGGCGDSLIRFDQVNAGDGLEFRELRYGHPENGFKPRESEEANLTLGQRRDSQKQQGIVHESLDSLAEIGIVGETVPSWVIAFRFAHFIQYGHVADHKDETIMKPLYADALYSSVTLPTPKIVLRGVQGHKQLVFSRIEDEVGYIINRSPLKTFPALDQYISWDSEREGEHDASEKRQKPFRTHD